MRPSRHRTIRGFTLIELMIVLTLMGIFTGLMLVEMSGTFENALLRSSARDLISGMGLAHSRAVSRNQTHLFQFERAQSAFAIHPEKRPAPDGPTDTETRKIDERVSVEIRDTRAVLPPEENDLPPPDQQPKRDVIYFYADGTADGREIVLRDNSDSELVLRINPVTGRVRIVEEPATP